VADGDNSVSMPPTARNCQQQQQQQGQLLPLDAAILKSIELCPNDELKRKMFSCILLVGGGGRFRGMERYLMGKLALQVPPQYRSRVVR
jgi:actin-related protein